MLLLLVLTALSFFLLLGAFLIISAVRARTAARAFANATQAAAVDGIQSRTLLDEALLIALRGSKDTNVRTRITESILGDKYGTAGSGTGTVSLAYNPASPLLTATATGLTLGRLHGRVLTIVPNPAVGGPVSFRTVGGTGSTVFLANTPLRPGFPPATLPTVSAAYPAFVNGREFSFTGSATTGTTAAEPWDAYDASNPWLAQPVLSGSDGQVTGFRRVSFSGTSAATVDNDNDGIADGVWLDGVLPSRPSPNGTFSYRVSYLVLDLDGRININAAGMPDRAQGPYTGSPDVPLGMGYGPADLDPSLVVSTTPSLPSATGTSAFTGSGAATPTDLWYANFLSSSGSTSAGVATDSQRRPPPGIALVGRYGRDGVPGSPGDDTRGGQQTTGTSTDPARYALTVAGTNAAADLKGQMRVYMTAASGTVTPSLTFFVAQTGTDAADDPYEVRLVDGGPRPAVAVSGSVPFNDDNPFTLSELERVLRASDADAATLPPRLAAGLSSVAQASRMRITTDSWDTPAITGSAAARIQAELSGTSIASLAYPWTNANAASPDVAAGLRFNLNRPLTTAAQTQEYCKGLYTLVRALDSNLSAQQAAQWAVNVCDFRDDDSRMTGFEYDTNLGNGWNVDGDLATTNDSDRAVVWGVERPDLLVAETAAWRETTSGSSQLFVNLVRPPWTASIITTGSTVASVERLDPTLGAGNNLAIASSTGGSPVWQLRFSGSAMSPGTAVVQFTAVSGSTTQNQRVLTGTGVTTGTSTILGGATAVDALAPGGQCIVAPANPQFFNVTASPARCTVSQGGTFAPAAGITSGTVWLERLADPTRANGIDNPYVVVDAAPFSVCAYAAPATPTLQTQPRPSSGAAPSVFWRSPATWNTVTGTGIGSYNVSGTASWFHWPNRPFVSQAELALVPADSSRDLLRNYDVSTSSTTSLVSGTTALAGMLLDATYVPSRFAGCGTTVTSSTIASCGLDRLNANQFSAWREPGRVNVNTIPTGTSSAVTIDSLVWATLLGGTSLPLTSGTVTVNPFVPSGTNAATPATSTARLLSLSGTAARPMATGSFGAGDSALRDRNPFFTYATAIRLANTATIRSHVFAIWITLETTDSGDDSRTCHRLFAIVDRSIPVGFREGENLNVRDTIRLRRFLE